jgi:FMN phosphatase YigB (HAD superfamily)
MFGKKVVVFDWGRTLHDPDTNDLFPGVRELLTDLSKKYTLALITLPSSETAEERRRKIEHLGVAKFVPHIFVAETDKAQTFEKLLKDLNVDAEEIVIIDDRAIRGIAWGNAKGATTIWLRKGKFADELPNEQTGQPTHTIHELSKLSDLLL